MVLSYEFVSYQRPGTVGPAVEMRRCNSLNMFDSIANVTSLGHRREGSSIHAFFD